MESELFDFDFVFFVESWHEEDILFNESINSKYLCFQSRAERSCKRGRASGV